MFSNNKKTKINIDMSNWLHISPTSGRGSTQMTISADTNQTTDIRRAKIIVTAGTLSKTIEVIQYPMAGDIMCTYNQAPTGVKLINTIGILDAVVISSEYGSVRLTGSSLNQLTANTVYTFSGQTPSQLTVNYYLNSNFNNTLTRDIFRDLDGLVSVSIMNKVNTLSESFYNNMNLERIDMYSGVTGYSMGVDYEVGGSVVYMCPKLYQFTGDSPLIYNQNMLKYQNKVIGVTLGSVSSVNIPEGVTGLTYGLCEIPSGYPNTISAVTLPSTLKTIDGHCFGNLNITGLTIPSAVTKIGLNVFSGCTQLTAITANNATCSAVTISPTTFFEIATGGTLYYPEGSDYSSWLSEDEYYLGYYLWKDSRAFALENVSTYYMQFLSGATGSSNAQSVFINATRGDYQLNVSDNQSQTASTQSDWVVVSGTPAAGNVEYKIYPSTTAQTQRFAYIHIVEGDRIWATVTVEQLPVNDVSFQLENVSTYYLQFSSGQTGSSNYQSVFVTANKADYQINVSDNQTATASTQTSWLTVSGTPASGYTEFKIYPTSTASTERNAYIHITHDNRIYSTITVQQLSGVQFTVSIEVSKSFLGFESEATGAANSQIILVNSNVVYTIENDNSWLTVSGVPASGVTMLTVYPNQYYASDGSRYGFIKLKYNGNVYQTITVSQIGVISGVDLYAIYEQDENGVYMCYTHANILAATISCEYGEKTLTGTALSALSRTTIYQFDGHTPSILYVSYTLKSTTNGYVPSGLFVYTEDLLSLYVYDKGLESGCIDSCAKLQHLYLNSGVTTYQSTKTYYEPAKGAAVSNCTSLSGFSGESPLITNDRNYLVYDNNLIGAALGGKTNLNIPNGITSITALALSHVAWNGESNCTITSITIPNTVVYMGVGALQRQSSITSITLSNNTTRISDSCFNGCSALTSIVIPSSVTFLDTGVFTACRSLSSITVENTSSSSITIKDDTFMDIMHTGGTLFYPQGSNYNTWLSHSRFYLGYYNWSGATY